MDSITEAAPVRTRKPRGQGASRRGEILDAAKRLFVEEGFEHATMRRIAGEVGVSPTALYLHFADKEAILAAIAEDFFSELLVLLEASRAGDAPPLVRFRAGLRAYVEFGLDRADEYRLTFFNRTERAAPPTSTENRKADQSFDFLSSSVGELIAAGLFRPLPQILVAEAIWVCMHGVTAALMDMAHRCDSGRDPLITIVIDTVVTGFSTGKVGG